MMDTQSFIKEHFSMKASDEATLKFDTFPERIFSSQKDFLCLLIYFNYSQWGT